MDDVKTLGNKNMFFNFQKMTMEMKQSISTNVSWFGKYVDMLLTSHRLLTYCSRMKYCSMECFISSCCK